MKKLVLVALAYGMTLSGFAQMTSGLKINEDPKVDIKTLTKNTNEKTDVNDWYNFMDEVEAVFSNGTNYFTVLFPDTAVKMHSTTPTPQINPVNWHSMGQVFDPKGDHWFSKSTKMDSNDLYTVDSIALLYRYIRHQTAAADTLIVQFFNHDQLIEGGFVAPNTERFKTTEYNFNTLKATNPTEEVVIVLDDDDSTALDASSGDFMFFAPNMTVSPGEVMAVVFTYIPGNTYVEGDTIYSEDDSQDNKINRFDVFYRSDASKFYVPGYFNSALTVPDEVRYNTGSSWDGIYIPGNAYDLTNIQMNVDFHVNATNVGVQDVNEYGFVVTQNYPNPFSNQTVVEYAITSTSNVNLEVFDITGKSVIVINEGLKNAGEHKVIIDGTNLKAGVYYYAFRTDAGQVTKKMLIQR